MTFARYLFFALALFCTDLTKAEKITNDTSAVFVFKSPSTDQSFIFALNVVEATGDLYFHLEAPAGQAWAAVGIGSSMKDSLILAAYPSDNGTGVTVSPRIASGHSESTYSKSLNVELLWPAGLDNSNTISRDGMLRADGVCRNCTTWSSGDGLLGYVSFSVPFIFAVGPSQPMRSSSLDASMRRHDFYGHFTMNVTAATSRDVGSVPRPNSGNGTYESQGVSEARNMIGDNNTAPAAHALIMIAAFVFLFPLGSLLLRLLNKALWHGIVQILALVFILVGFGIGIHISKQYNKSKKFTSAHQLMGLVIVVILLFQLGLGILHHRIWKQTKSPTKSPTKFSKIHKYVGPAVFLLGLINAGLGFNLAENSSYHSRYVVVILTVAVFYFATMGIKWWWTKRREGRKQQHWAGSAASENHYGRQEPYGPAVPLRPLPSRS